MVICIVWEVEGKIGIAATKLLGAQDACAVVDRTQREWQKRRRHGRSAELHGPQHEAQSEKGVRLASLYHQLCG